MHAQSCGDQAQIWIHTEFSMSKKNFTHSWSDCLLSILPIAFRSGALVSVGEMPPPNSSERPW